MRPRQCFQKRKVQDQGKRKTQDQSQKSLSCVLHWPFGFLPCASHLPSVPFLSLNMCPLNSPLVMSFFFVVVVGSESWMVDRCHRRCTRKVRTVQIYCTTRYLPVVEKGLVAFFCVLVCDRDLVFRRNRKLAKGGIFLAGKLEGDLSIWSGRGE